MTLFFTLTLLKWLKMTLNFTNFNTDQDSYLHFPLQWHMLVRVPKAITQMCIQSADPFSPLCLYS